VSFNDKDGSITGVPNSYIVIDGGIAPDEACEPRPDWNASVCKGDIGRMNIGGGAPGGGGGGRGGGPGGGGNAAARPGGPGAGPGAGANAAARPPAGGPGGAPTAGGNVTARPAAAPAGAAPAPLVGARLGRLGGPPAQPPVILTRNGKDFPVSGQTNVRAGTEFKVTTERPALNLSVTELDKGSWVIFELPGFTKAASGTEVSSMDALRNATATSYYKANGSLWVKLVSSGDVWGSGLNAGPSGGATLQASR
jgi:cell migration-inducing and hyaluronan-binding protein